MKTKNQSILDPITDAATAAIKTTFKDVKKFSKDLAKGNFAEAADDMLNLPADVVKSVEGKEAENLDSAINNLRPKKTKTTLNRKRKLEENLKPVVENRPRTGKPYVDGLVGVEANPGPNPKKSGATRNMKRKNHKVAIRKIKIRNKQKPKRRENPKPKNPSINATSVLSTALTTVFKSKCWQKVSGRGTNLCRVVGKQRLTTVATPASGHYTGSVLAYSNITSGLFTGTRVAPYFEQYERWRPNKIAFTLVPHTSSNTTGSYYMFVEPDPDDAISTSGVMDINAIANQASVVETPVWGTANHAVRIKDRKDPDLYTGSAVPAFVEAGLANAEPRLFSAGQLLIVEGDAIANSLTIGTLYIDYDITFKIGVEGSSVTPALDLLATTSTSSAETEIGTFVASGALTNTSSLANFADMAASFLSSSSLDNAGVYYDAANLCKKTVSAWSYDLQLSRGEYLFDMALLLGTTGTGLTNLTSIYGELDTAGGALQTIPKVIKDQAGARQFGNNYLRFYDQCQSTMTFPTTLNANALSPLNVIKGKTDYPIRLSGYTGGTMRLYRCTDVFSVGAPINTIGNLVTRFNFNIKSSYSANTANINIIGVSIRVIRLFSGPRNSLFFPYVTAPLNLTARSGKDEVKKDENDKYMKLFSKNIEDDDFSDEETYVEGVGLNQLNTEQQQNLLAVLKKRLQSTSS